MHLFKTLVSGIVTTIKWGGYRIECSLDKLYFKKILPIPMLTNVYPSLSTYAVSSVHLVVIRFVVITLYYS